MLLIGAGGFIGGHLREAASAAGLRVSAPPRLPTGGSLACNLLDPESVVECVAQAQPDLVANLAGSASVADSWRDPGAGFAANATAVLNLLEAVAAQAPSAHVLLASSAQVYGQPDRKDAPFAEDAPLRPLTPYGASKLAMEALAGQYARGAGLRIAVARLFNQVGPGQPATLACSEFARDIALAEREGGESVELAVAHPDSSRDFSDVRDSAAALLALSRGELAGTYNVCSGRPTALREAIAMLASMTPLDVRLDATADAAQPGGPSSSFGDPGKLREAIGLDPAIPLERSLRELLEWWRRRSGGS
jgi:GDP-4-dehydro-6-deoxy-D-mannose reductase